MSKVSFKELILKFAELPELVTKEIEKEIKKSAIKIRDDAVKKFGEYQPEVGSYPAWEQLKEATIKQKEKAGGSEDPLIGHSDSNGSKVWSQPLRNTIGIKTEKLTAAVGTDDPLGEYHEYGTEHIPPRPFLRPALYENQDNIKNNVKEGIQNGVKVL
jgi:HK97 gp10 family phage protein